MNQDKAIEILRLFQQQLENAIEQKSLHFKTNAEEIKEALEFLKFSYSYIQELLKDTINVVDNSNIQPLSSNKVIFNLPNFNELNEKLIQLFPYIEKGKI